jgi:subtilisin family serine protease
MAYQAGADIITSSIGGPSGFTDGAWATVASRLVELGVVVTISAGNEGEEGPFYASSGSSGKNVLAVASLDPTVIIADPFQATFALGGVSNVMTLGYRTAYDPWEIKGYPIMPLSFDTSNPAEACQPLPAGSPNLSNVIAMVRRGGCNFSVKQANLMAFGAKYIVFYNTENPIVNPATDNFDSAIAMIERDAGEAIIATVKAGGNVTADFTIYPNWKVGVYNSAGGIPSEYTTWGGTYELDIKPDIAAPGRNIYSTYVENSWAVLSGTSMACPYVAGVAALYISKFGGRSIHGPEFAKKLVDKIISSGNAVPWQVMQPTGLPVNYGYWAPVPQVGTGMINAKTLLESKTSLTFDKIALNDTGHFSRYHDVLITNGGDKAVTYTFKLQPAGGLNMQSPYPSFLVNFLEMTPVSIIPEVSFPSGKFAVGPGQSKTAQ